MRADIEKCGIRKRRIKVMRIVRLETKKVFVNIRGVYYGFSDF